MNNTQHKLHDLLSKLKPIKCALDRCIYFYHDEDTLAECKNGIDLCHGYIICIGDWSEEEINCHLYKK